MQSLLKPRTYATISTDKILSTITDNIEQRPVPSNKGRSFRVQYIVFTSYVSEFDTDKALRNDGADWYVYGREVCP